MSEEKKGVDLSSGAPVVKNEAGGKGSDTGCTLYQVPKALLRVGAALDHGRKKYSDYNWKSVEIKDHLSRVVVHIMGYLAGNREDDHLGHAACRALMGLELSLERGEEKPSVAPGGLVHMPEGMKPEHVTFVTELKCGDCHAEYFEEGDTLTKVHTQIGGGRWLCKRCLKGPQSTGTPR